MRWRPAATMLTWTPAQRAALIGVALLILVYLTVRYAVNPAYVANPQPDQPSRANQLADRIDPNTADWETLAALPQLGEKRAKSIIEYRLRYQRLRPDEPAFQKSEDLLRIRGIGVATVEQLRAFLVFPNAQTRPTTRP